jgi:hypothetical protein
MADEAIKSSATKGDWAARFVMNLCLIAWCCALAEFVLPLGAIKKLCILFGSHAAILSFVTALLFWPLRRKAIFFLLLLLTSVPLIYFGLIIRNLARMRGWLAT